MSTMDIFNRFIAHQKYYISIGLSARLQAPRSGERVVIPIDLGSLFQYALAVSAAKDKPGFNDIRKYENGLACFEMEAAVELVL